MPSVFQFFWETLVNVRSRFSIVRHALGTLHGRSLVNVAKRSGEKIFLSMHKFFSSVQRLCNVWAETLRNVCKTLYKRYKIVQFVTLSFRMRLTIVRKRWHSFVLYKPSPQIVAVDAQLFSLGRKETLSTGLVTISGSLHVPQAVILTKPLNQFILNAQVRYSAILARLILGCYWRTGSTWRFFFIIRIAMRKRSSCRKRWSFSSGVEACFFPLPRPLSVMFIHRFLWHKSTDYDVCQRFYTVYRMTSWHRH